MAEPSQHEFGLSPGRTELKSHLLTSAARTSKSSLQNSLLSWLSYYPSTVTSISQMSTLQRTRPKSQQPAVRSRTVADTQTQTQTQTESRTKVTVESDRKQQQAQTVDQDSLIKQSVAVATELVVAALSCVAYLR